MGETKAPLVENTRLREEEPGHRAQILAEVVTICLDLVSYVTPSSDNPEDAMHMFFLIKFIPLGVSGTPHRKSVGLLSPLSGDDGLRAKGCAEAAPCR